MESAFDFHHSKKEKEAVTLICLSSATVVTCCSVMTSLGPGVTG
jgi:hypothetical protein